MDSNWDKGFFIPVFLALRFFYSNLDCSRLGFPARTDVCASGDYGNTWTPRRSLDSEGGYYDTAFFDGERVVTTKMVRKCDAAQALGGNGIFAKGESRS